jgi:membrane protease YdiL (CAAX protease family)
MSSSTSAPTPLPTQPSWLRLIFVGPNGLRAGWRFVVFLLIFGTAAVIPALVLGHFVPRIPAWAKSQPRGMFTPGYLIFYESWQTVFLFLAVFVMSKIEKRAFSDYGLPKRGAFGRKFWLGSAVGLGGVLLQIALIATLGGYSPGPLALGGGSALQSAFVWAIAFLLAAVNEEFTFRGYLQKTLATGIGFWPTALVLSTLFGALHLGNPGERWPGIVMLFCFGMLAAFTLRVTGDLWFILGLHATWDWGHVFLFSVPIAGMRGTQQLLHASLRGPRWLTGGSVGPDGSVFAFVVLLCIVGLVYRLFSSGKRFDIATTGADACGHSSR